MSDQTGIVETTPYRSRLMSRVGQRNTPPELAVRKIISELGYRFRTEGKDLPGSPDIVNRRRRWIVFVHGCFWHAHRRCSKAKLPKRNRPFWRKKLIRNRKRDREAEKELIQLGYRVLVVWQCELLHHDFIKRRLRTFLEEATKTSYKLNGQRYPKLGFSYSTHRDDVYLSIKLSPTKTLRHKRKISFSSTRSKPPEDFDQAFLRTKRRPPLLESSSKIHCADIFSGCGGLSLGVATACRHLGIEFSSALAIDSHQESMEVYRSNFDVGIAHAGDVREFVTKNIGEAVSEVEALRLARLPQIDFLMAGPPCQGHSNLNNHTRRRDTRNKLYLCAARFVELVRPRYVLIENVPAVLNSEERVVDKTCRSLKRLGYHVDSGIVDLARIGVPQSRRRHVLIGSLNGEVSVPEVTDRFSVERIRTVRWAIADLASTKDDSLFDSTSELSAENRRRIQYLFKHKEYDLPKKLRPFCHQKSHSYKSMYGRLRSDQPAQTITTGFGSPGQGRFIHPTRQRTLTPHEAARLQCFPDFFDFSAATTRTSIATMIGNAVPVPLSYIFAMELLTRDYAYQRSER